MLKLRATIFFVLLISLAGCTIEKRLYRKGWYISFAPLKKQPPIAPSQKTEQLPADTAIVFKPTNNRLRPLEVAVPDSTTKSTTAEVSFRLFRKDSVCRKLDVLNKFERTYRYQYPDVRIRVHVQKPFNERRHRIISDLLIVIAALGIVFLFGWILTTVTITPLAVLSIVLWPIFLIMVFFIIWVINKSLRGSKARQTATERVKRPATEAETVVIRRLRKKRLIAGTIFILLLLALTLLLLLPTGSLDLLIAFPLMLLLILVAVWTDYRRKNNQPEFITEEQQVVNEASGTIEELSKKSSSTQQSVSRKLRSAIFFTFFISVIFVIVVLLILESLTLTGWIGITVVFALLVWILWLEYVKARSLLGLLGEKTVASPNTDTANRVNEMVELHTARFRFVKVLSLCGTLLVGLIFIVATAALLTQETMIVAGIFACLLLVIALHQWMLYRKAKRLTEITRS